MATQSLDPTTQDRLRKLREQHGEKGAAQLVGVSQHTLARAVAAFPVYRGTSLIIRIRLAELSAASEAAA